MKIAVLRGSDIENSMNRDPDWSLFRTFLAVLQEGSQSAAARRLGLTQPTVARHLDLLEAAVGADLFLRTQRGLVPTELGLALRPQAEALQSTAAAMMRQASAANDEVSGVVRISASEVIGVEHLPPFLAGLRRRHPALAIELVATNAVDDLLKREADVAVRNVEPRQAALVCRRVPSAELGLYAHRSYLAERGTPRSIADLAHHDLIGFDRETPALRPMIQRYPWLAQQAFALRTDSNLAQLAAIRASFGIGVCQAPRLGRDPDLVRILPEDLSIELGIWVVVHEDQRSAPRCRAVFDALVQGLSAGR